MVSCTKQKRAALLEWKDTNNPSIPEQGGSRGYYSTTPVAKDSQRNPPRGQAPAPSAAANEAAAPDAHSQNGATAVARAGAGFHQTDIAALYHLAVCRHLDRG